MDTETYLGFTPLQETELLNDILLDDVSNEDYSKFEEALKQARELEGLKSTVTPADWYYFHFYEPFPNENEKHTAISENNRLYMTKNDDGNYRLKGYDKAPHPSMGPNYDVTQIRPNKDFDDQDGTIDQNDETQLFDGDCETIKCIE